MESDDDFDLPEVPLSKFEEDRDEMSVDDVVKYRQRLAVATKALEEIKSAEERENQAKLQDDEEFIAYAKRAKEMWVKPPTISDLTSLVPFLDSHNAFNIFNHETLDLRKFYKEVDKVIPPCVENILGDELLEKYVYDGILENLMFDEVEEILFSRYLFFLMSVHPDYHMVQQSFSFITFFRDFKPTFSDIVTVFCNWGTNVKRLFRNVPSNYALPSSLQPDSGQASGPQSTGKTIIMNCVERTLDYLLLLFRVKMCEEYFPILEPIIHICMDREIFLINRAVIIRLLILLSLAPKDAWKIVPFDKMNLSALTTYCNCIYQEVPMGASLAYATLQRYLGVNPVVFEKELNLNDVYRFCKFKFNVICKSSFTDLECFMRLIFLCVWSKINHSKMQSEEDLKYLDLMHKFLMDVSANVRETQSAADHAILRELMSNLGHQLNLRRKNFSAVP